jgi:hypothetical protein
VPISYRRALLSALLHVSLIRATTSLEPISYGGALLSKLLKVIVYVLHKLLRVFVQVTNIILLHKGFPLLASADYEYSPLTFLDILHQLALIG